MSEDAEITIENREVIILNDKKLIRVIFATLYNKTKEILISTRNKMYQTADFAMIDAYCDIGKSIIVE